MLVSHDHQFVYINTSRVTGWEAELYFEPYCLRPDTFENAVEREGERTKHGIVSARTLSARKQPDPDGTIGPMKRPDRLRKLVGPARWPKYLKFGVVRNPFDMTVAWFHAWMPDYERERLQGLEFSATRQVFRDWLVVSPHLPELRRVLMLEGEMFLDEIIRFEALEEGVERVCAKLDLPFEPARLEGPYRQKDAFAPWADYYDDETRDVVRGEFGWMFRAFDYDSDS